MFHETILTVRDLELCRCFYRDTLALGEPVCDNNYSVSFRLGSDSHLMLVKESELMPCRNTNGCFISLDHPQFDLVAANLQKEDMPLVPLQLTAAIRCYRGCDPEGNIFLLSPENPPNS